MKRLASLAVAVLLTGCTSAALQIRRLTPVSENSEIPARCTLASVLAGSPAQKAGMSVGDAILTVNGTTPKNADDVASLVNKSVDDMVVTIISPSTATTAASNAVQAVQTLHVILNKTRPRLGAVCDLTGWRKAGLTAAGNESITAFNGPLGVTASGIFEKGLTFMRIRISNNGNDSLPFDPKQLVAYDANREGLTVMDAHQVMCFLYGDKGARMLIDAKAKARGVDKDLSPPSPSGAAEGNCLGLAKVGKVNGADVQYARANAEYMAKESLSAQTIKPGETADGLVFLPEPTALPFTIEASLAGRNFSFTFGEPKATALSMKASELADFFKAQSKGAPVRVTLRKGQVFVGKFVEYDDDNEKVWFEANSGLLNTLSYSLPNIKAAEPIEQTPTKTPNDHVN